MATVDTLVIAGGGGGSSGLGGGGGGAGGYREVTGLSVAVTAYSVVVGNGGAGGSAGNSGVSGQDSSFSTVTSTGGGRANYSNNGSSGGSGGGGSYSGSGGSGTSGQGRNGGNAVTDGATYVSGGGGGGATGTGANGNTTAGGAGGNGTSSSINGTPTTRAGGGGGGGAYLGAGTTEGGAGGSGGGAAGSGSGVGGSASANTGGGGGGGGYFSGVEYAGGNGGSGIVIIRYLTGTITATGGTITTSGGYTIHTFTSSGTFTVTVIAVGSVGSASGSGTASAGSSLPYVDVLIVAGGGGGGAGVGGGGGGGGVISLTGHSVSIGAYPVSVGAGGDGGTTSAAATAGGNSSFDGNTAIGGARGATSVGAGAGTSAAGNGASGGGGSHNNPTGGTGTAGQGYAGGTAASLCSAGGGGYGAVGFNTAGVDAPGAPGGPGFASSITGTTESYSGGGGGGASSTLVNYAGGSGGSGVGGNGGSAFNATSGTPPTNGSANHGGGGGGAGYDGTASFVNGAAGGVGRVVVSYPLGTLNATGGTSVITSGGKRIHIFDSGGTFTVGTPGPINVAASPYYAVGDGSTVNNRAFQDALTDAASLGVPLYVPSGRYRLTVGLTPTVSIFGDGIDRSVLMFDADVDGLVYSLGNHYGPPGGGLAPPVVRDLSITTTLTQVTNQRWAMKVTYSNETPPTSVNGCNVTVERVSIRPYNQFQVTDERWYGGIRLDYCFNARLSNVFIYGCANKSLPSSVGSNMGYGIYLANVSNDIDIDHCQIFSADIAINVGGNTEGTRITNATIVPANYGVKIISGAANPWAVVANSHIAAFVTGVYLNSHPQCVIQGNLFYKGGGNAGDNNNNNFNAVHITNGSDSTTVIGNVTIEQSFCNNEVRGLLIDGNSSYCTALGNTMTSASSGHGYTVVIASGSQHCTAVGNTRQSGVATVLDNGSNNTVGSNN